MNFTDYIDGTHGEKLIINGEEYVYSKYCINEGFGFDLMADGTLKPRKLGRYVKCVECFY